MNTKKQAQAALTIMGRPTFINKRKEFRTWKWYCDGVKANDLLKKAGVNVHSMGRRGHPYMFTPGHVTIQLPLSFSLKDFNVPKPKPEVQTTDELRERALAVVNAMGRMRLQGFLRKVKSGNI